MKRYRQLVTAGVALSILGVLTGCSTAGNKSTSETHQSGSVSNKTDSVKSEGTQATSDESMGSKAGPKQPIIGVKQYANQTLIPKRPIPIIAPSLLQNGVGNPVPVVQVPVTAAVGSEVSVNPPVQVNAAVTPAQAKQLAAYLIPVNQYTWLYLLGPRGMHGKVELAADGSASISLTEADATIELSLSGGSPVMAASLSKPFFESARTNMVSYGLDKQVSKNNIPNTTVQYRYNHHVAVFAFENTKGQSVYGYNYYNSNSADAGPFDQGTVFTYEATGVAKSLTSAVMASALANLQDIGESSVNGPTVATKDSTVQFGTKSVKLETPSLPSFTPQAVDTSAGIVWLSQPGWISAYPKQSHGLIPNGPFFINLTKQISNSDSLSKTPSQTLVTIPAYQLGVSVNEPLYNNVWFEGTAGSKWVLYTVSGAAPGMNDAANSALYAVNAGNPGAAPTFISSYMDGGGGFFFVGHSGSTVVYDVANDLNPNGNIKNSISMIDLSTGKRTPIPSNDLKNGIVTVNIDGTTQHVKLKEV